MRVQAAAQEAWKQFKETANAAPLLALIAAHPELRQPPSDIRHPYVHRLVDVLLANRPFRVCRAIVWNQEHLFFTEIDFSCFNLMEPGVPEWLTGPRLLQWIRQEAENPAKQAIDWEKWR
jgi:hypothetical protein